ncbi:MAG TPA: site-specific DNA-methyltransferase [Cytophagales bacterium]|nr:site-specific DNA-methyltransferase [Cytophagales bacterium]
MNKEQRITNNIKVPNKDLEALKIHFPHCFDKDGNFQFEKFKNSLSEKEINFSTESYGLDWLGKSYARLLASDPATTLLKADDTHNAKPENTNSENLLIKGDNLEVLKHLTNAYYEQVKMIYIDPPYNTGGDGFIYDDNRKFTAKELQQLIGVDAEKAKRILDFTKQKSNSHSAWLTFLYPRLYIAKQLLKDDGIIFVSIDDNEVAQLRLLLDEIFGEENFIAQIIQNKLNSKNDTDNIQKNHEYVVCYRKNPIFKESSDAKALLENKKVITTEVFKEGERYYIINDSITTRGDGGTLNSRKNLGYTVYFNPNTSDFIGVQDYDLDLALTSNEENEVYKDDSSLIAEGYIKIRPPKVRGKLGAWTWDLKNFNNSKDQILIKKTRNGYSVKKRTFIPSKDVILKEGRYYFTYIETTNSRSIIEFSTNEGASQLSSLLEAEGVFNNPKNVDLLQYLISLVPQNDFICLDFFGGSGTTGDAVLQINAKDDGTRKFILAQLPELIDPKKNKAAYDFVKDELKAEPTIFEITKERLIRAAAKIRKENNDYNGDLGFKIFETTPIWEDYDFEATELDNQTKLFDESKLNEDDIKALLTTWKTYDGIALTQNLAHMDLSGYTAYYGNNKLYLMNKSFSTDHLKALLEKIDSDKKFNPTSIICFGYHFESKNLRELSENVKSYANKKNIDIDFITRY